MACHCEIHLAGPNAIESKTLAQIAINEVLRIEEKYSRYRRDSVVSMITAQAGRDWVLCDDETLFLLEIAGNLFNQSGGLFDITSGVLRRAWNFQEAAIPDTKSLQNLCSLVNWTRVQRDGQLVRLSQWGMELDFGGFGKEYAADQAAAVLRTQGVKHGYINLGGDIHVIGPQPDGQPWIIGIQDPRCKGKLLGSISLSNGAVATSGDYERYFEIDARRFCHILDPLSGQPVDFWRSISVFAPTTLVAGGLATIAMLKQGQALSFLDKEKVLYLAVDQASKMYRNLSPLIDQSTH